VIVERAGMALEEIDISDSMKHASSDPSNTFQRTTAFDALAI